MTNRISRSVCLTILRVGWLFIVCLSIGGLVVIAQEPSLTGFRDQTADLGLLLANSKACWCYFNGDLVTAGKLLENLAAMGHWLSVRLEGDGSTVNRSAIGAQVCIRLGDHTLTRQAEASTGEGNQNDVDLHSGPDEQRQPGLSGNTLAKWEEPNHRECRNRSFDDRANRPPALHEADRNLTHASRGLVQRRAASSIASSANTDEPFDCAFQASF